MRIAKKDIGLSSYKRMPVQVVSDTKRKAASKMQATSAPYECEDHQEDILH